MSSDDSINVDADPTKGTDVVPPGTQERVMSTGYFFGEHVDALVIKWREATQECVKYTPERPHIDTLAIPFILHDFRSRIPYSSAWSHCLLIPHDFTKTEVGDLDTANATTTDSWNELALILFFFIIRAADRGRIRGDDGNAIKEKVLGFDVTVDNTAFFMQISNTVRNLEDNVTSKILAKIGKFDDLMK